MLPGGKLRAHTHTHMWQPQDNGIAREAKMAYDLKLRRPKTWNMLKGLVKHYKVTEKIAIALMWEVWAEFDVKSIVKHW